LAYKQSVSYECPLNQQYLVIAAELLMAANNGDAAGVEATSVRRYPNAHDIAVHMSEMNAHKQWRHAAIPWQVQRAIKVSLFFLPTQFVYRLSYYGWAILISVKIVRVSCREPWLR
jgi:hypothetical protein